MKISHETIKAIHTLQACIEEANNKIIALNRAPVDRYLEITIGSTTLKHRVAVGLVVALLERHAGISQEDLDKLMHQAKYELENTK